MESKTKTDEEDKTNPAVRSLTMARRYVANSFYIALLLALITWIGYVFIPSKKDCYVIVAGGAVGSFIQSDSAAKKIPTEALQLLRDKIREESANISISGVTDTLANKSKEELIKLIKDKK